MNYVALIGYAAGTLTTLSFVPQVVRSYRTRSVKDISSAMLIAFVSGVTLWLLYGIATQSNPIIIANAVTLGLTIPLLVMKFLFR